jgi:predicted metalloprotease with PDZ domain
MKFLIKTVILSFLSLSIYCQEINYTLSIENPHRNYFHLKISYNVQDENYVDFVMPAWTPGSYVIQDWSKNVIDVRAENNLHSVLNCYKIDKQTWRVEANQSDVIKFSYKVYAYSINNPYHAHIGKDFAYFNGAVIFMYIKGKKDIPYNLKFIYPNEWEIHTSLQTKLNKDIYQAKNFDEFIDCPSFLGKLHKLTFDVHGKEHYVVFNGWFDINENQIIDDLTKMIKWFYDVFGELPYKHYTFFLRVSSSGGGGIEHLYSNVSSVTPQSLKGDIDDGAYYNKLLMLESHEFFHLYNVKRIRPTGLGPFDYTDETYTKMLWVSEGFTSYYTHRPLLKAGVLDENKILESWSTLVNRLHNNVALNLKPVSQYSFDAWLRSDIPDYSFRTYYTKGALIALLFDIEMRLQSDHKKNMDGFFNFLYHNVYKQNKTFDLELFYDYLTEYSKVNFSDFFSSYVSGINKLPLADYLNKIGLDLKVVSEIPFLGIKLNAKINNAAIIYYVYPNSPADKLNISRGDHIISIDREKVTKENWIEILNKINFNEDIELQWNHNNQLIASDVNIKDTRVTEYSIVKMPDITLQQEQFLKELLSPKM